MLYKVHFFHGSTCIFSIFCNFPGRTCTFLNDRLRRNNVVKVISRFESFLLTFACGVVMDAELNSASITITQRRITSPQANSSRKNSNLLITFTTSLLLKELLWQKDGCSLAYHTLVEYISVCDILQSNPKLLKSYLMAMNDRGLTSEVNFSEIFI